MNKQNTVLLFKKKYEANLLGLLNEKAFRLMGKLRPSRISAPTGTGALQTAPGKSGLQYIITWTPK